MTTARRAGRRTVVLVSGGGSNLQALIDRVQAGRLDVDLAAVISDRPGILALQRAATAGLPAQVVDYRESPQRDAYGARLHSVLSQLGPDILVLAGFMRILSRDMVNAFLGRMLNVHPSLLPLYPGLDTYRRALAAGDSWHGSTVHFVTPELDAGPAIAQFRVPIHAAETVASLQERVQRGEHRLYPEVVGWLADGRVRYHDGRAWLDGQALAHPVQVNEGDPPAPAG